MEQRNTLDNLRHEFGGYVNHAVIMHVQDNALAKHGPLVNVPKFNDKGFLSKRQKEKVFETSALAYIGKNEVEINEFRSKRERQLELFQTLNRQLETGGLNEFFDSNWTEFREICHYMIDVMISSTEKSNKALAGYIGGLVRDGKDKRLQKQWYLQWIDHHVNELGMVKKDARQELIKLIRDIVHSKKLSPIVFSVEEFDDLTDSEGRLRGLFSKFSEAEVYAILKYAEYEPEEVPPLSLELYKMDSRSGFKGSNE